MVYGIAVYIDGMEYAECCKNGNIDWKARAIDRRLVNKELKKRIKELTISRDVWKEKAIERKEAINQQNKHIVSIKKNIQKIMHL